MRRPALLLPGLVLALALGACGASSTPAASPATSSAPASSAPASSAPASSAPASPSPSGAGDVAAFCSELAANGAGGSDFGAIPTFYPKADLLADVQGKLKVMGDATPPAEIADAWALQKATLEKVEAAARKLPSGGHLTDVRYASSDRVVKAEDAITAYWFASCR